MIIRDVNLETVCGVTSKLPENTLPEFAFAGKSNVGKSSLINALMNRKAYARTSSQPGRTRPRRVISPVMATSRCTGVPDRAETSAVQMVTPAEGPSLGTAPSGTWTWISLFL